MLLAQIADMFDESIWTIIFLVCIGSPLLGTLVNASSPRHWRQWAFLTFVGGYCLLLTTLYILMGVTKEEPAVCMAFFAVLLCGPVLGLVLMFSRRAPQESPPVNYITPPGERSATETAARRRSSPLP